MGEDELDEELAEPPRREWPGWHRARTPVLVLTAAAIVGAGTLTLAGGDERRPQPTPTPNGGSTLSVSFDPYTGQDALPAPDPQVVSEPTVSRQLPLCPVRRICRTLYTVPATVVTAIRAHLPGAQVLSARTLVVRRAGFDTLNARLVSARAGLLTIRIEVRPQRTDDVEFIGGTQGSDGVSGLALALLPRYTAIVSVTGPARAAITTQVVADLAADQRLTEVGG